MEAFSLLKYWKAGGAAKLSVSNALTPTIVATLTEEDEDSFSDSGDGDGDDGPFFDLEFAVPADVDEPEEEVELRQKVENRETVIDEIGEEEVTQSLSFSPSDDLFFKGKILQIDGSDGEDLVVNTTGSKFHAPPSLAKSAAKLRVFMLGLKRSKSESNGNNVDGKNDSNSNSSGKSSKLMTVKLKMEDVRGPLISLLTRASSNSKLKNNNCGGVGDQNEKRENETVTASEECGESEKRDKKEVVQRYLKMVKLPGKNSQAAAELAAGRGRRGLSLKAVMAKKHLGKSKSAVVHSMPNNNQNHSKNETTSSKKRDDSLLQQQDGIQSAILHCKRSFNSSSSSSSQDGDETTSGLSRSLSDPSHEKQVTLAAVTAEVVAQENCVTEVEGFGGNRK